MGRSGRAALKVEQLSGAPAVTGRGLGEGRDSETLVVFSVAGPSTCAVCKNSLRWKQAMCAFPHDNVFTY